MANLTQLRVFSQIVPAEALVPQTAQHMRTFEFNLLQGGAPEVAGEGWNPVSHQIITLPDGQFLLTVLTERDPIDTL